MTVDPERDLVFVPTGSASPDLFGRQRPGDSKWEDSVVALGASSGELVWASNSSIMISGLRRGITATLPIIQHEGKRVPVVIGADKSGFLFVLARDTGKPVFPVEERPVPSSDIPEEKASRTQLFPVAPPWLVKQKYSADDAWNRCARARHLSKETRKPPPGRNFHTTQCQRDVVGARKHWRYQLERLRVRSECGCAVRQC